MQPSRVLATAILLMIALPAFPSDLNMPADFSGQQGNFITTAIQIDGHGGNRWYFTNPQNQTVLVNVQTDTNGNGVLEPFRDGWVYSTSFRAIDMGSSAHGPVAGTVAVGTVLSDTNTTYRNPKTGVSYGIVMYMVWQKDQSPSAGEICLSFSNDGLSWTRPISAVPTGWSGAIPDCADPSEPVLAEAVSGFHRSTNSIHLFYLNGDIPTLLTAFVPEGNQPPSTETLLASTTPTNPHILNVTGTVTTNGISTPPTGSSSAQVHALFINLSATWNPKTGAVYLTRLYAWPSSNNGSLCNTGVCPSSATAFPNRAQVWCMDAGGAIGRTTNNSFTWEKLFDQGRNQTFDGWGDGYDIQDVTCHHNSISHLDPLPAEDYESLDFVKTRTGAIWDRPGLSSGLEFQFVYGIQPNKKRKCNELGGPLAVLQLNRLATSGVVTIDCTKF